MSMLHDNRAMAEEANARRQAKLKEDIQDAHRIIQDLREQNKKLKQAVREANSFLVLQPRKGVKVDRVYNRLMELAND
jgi:hypothetical protein